jgi:hypothetical protein
MAYVSNYLCLRREQNPRFLIVGMPHNFKHRILFPKRKTFTVLNVNTWLRQHRLLEPRLDFLHHWQMEIKRTLSNCSSIKLIKWRTNERVVRRKRKLFQQASEANVCVTAFTSNSNYSEGSLDNEI